MPERPALFVRQSVHEQLLALRPRPWEIGGWLLGYWLDDDSGVVITHATPPALRGSALGITIDGRGGHSRRFSEAWEASGGQVTFLGDWHTHPRSEPVPSSQDEKAVRQLAEDESYGTPTPLMVIVKVGALPGSRTRPRVAYYLRRVGGEITSLPAEFFKPLPEEVTSVPEWAWPRPR